VAFPNSDPIFFAVSNPDADDAAVVYVGKQTTLALTLANNTGSDIPLQKSADDPSMLALFFPRFYSAEEVSLSTIEAVDWKIDRTTRGATLIYEGAAGVWPNGSILHFGITNLTTNSQPATGFFQLNSSNLGPSVDSSLTTNISLNDAPVEGNAELPKALAVSLDNQGSVYVSDRLDPLPNTLFLNLKNIGSESIYTGPDSGVGSPQIFISFIYGSTPGALATGGDPSDPQQDPAGSAWRIKATLAAGSQWRVLTPSYSDEMQNPVWTLKPTDTNFKIIGTGADANVLFSFDEIQSFTAPGHTQMIVQCTGFKRTETQRYDDHTYVIDIAKQLAPLTRGLLNFSGSNPLFTVYSPTTTSQVDLQWVMFGVPSVLLISNIPNFAPRTVTYPHFKPLAKDKLPITVPGVTQSALILFTLQALDGQGNYLNSLQFAAYIQADMFYDTRDLQVYPAILVGKVLWMAHNLNYAPDSKLYNNDPNNEAKYGRLYSWDQAAKSPQGWRLPTLAEWKAFIELHGDANAAYTSLMAGGKSGFNAELGGEWGPEAGFDDLDKKGYYWTSTFAAQAPGAEPETGGDFAVDAAENSAVSSYYYVQFSKASNSVSSGAVFRGDTMISVRYVRDLL